MESLALLAVAIAIVYLARKVELAMADFTRLHAALSALAASIAAVADRLADPAVDNNDQTEVDNITTTLNDAANKLSALASAGVESQADPSPSDSGDSTTTVDDGTGSSSGDSVPSSGDSSDSAGIVDDGSAGADSDDNTADGSEDEASQPTE